MTSQLFNIKSLLIGLISLTGLLSSCGGSGAPKAQDSTKVVTGQALKRTADSSSRLKDAAADSLHPQRLEKGDSLLVTRLSAKDLPINLLLSIQHSYQQIHLIIEDLAVSSPADSLVAHLSLPEGERNLRFNQVILPDSTMDGPFGEEVQYAIHEAGSYTLIIGKDNMADGQVEGPLLVDIRVVRP